MTGWQSSQQDEGQYGQDEGWGQQGRGSEGRISGARH
jgi:hypothetical protein